MNSYSVESEDIKNMCNLNKVVELKNYAINKMDFELAAMVRDQERFLETPEGLEFMKFKHDELLEKKLKRVLKK